MFGFLKVKPIDEELLKENVSEAVLKLWLDDNNLKYDRFSSFITLAKASGNEVKPIKFLTEKLRFITSIANTCLLNAEVEESTIQEIVDQIKEKVNEIAGEENKGATAALGLKAKKYTQVRFSSNPNKAGKMIEERFSRGAFSYVPKDSETDRRYTLYKSLSSLERTVIFEIGSSIRKSRV